jgi:hypothetical protein
VSPASGARSGGGRITGNGNGKQQGWIRSLSGFVTDREAAINLCQQRRAMHDKAIRALRKAASV